MTSPSDDQTDDRADQPQNSEGWLRAKELFADLCEATPQERSRVLDGYAPEDPIRSAAERLLRSLDSASGFMEERTSPGGGGAVSDGGLPQAIGCYTPLERLGEGGFGIVYRALQRHPVEREVAVKVLRPGLSSAQVLARFGDERRFLARLDHPDVVRVLDAGSTEDGRLFVVMDLAPGLPITAFVREREMAIGARVLLLGRVCRAVHAIHQRGIIHRDLKPSNIVVAQEDDGPRPRIIDFGIAAALDDPDRAGWTQMGAPIGTPRYASPEQASGGAVDTRTDIYALGMILGEMLAGVTPRPNATGVEAPATAPSKAAQQAGDAALARRLRGDLDRIVLKATAWDAQRRYDSAAALADDLDRYLRGMPVLASAPSRLYAARKFVSRHRAATCAGVIAAMALVAGLGVSLLATREANRQRSIAESSARRASFIGSFLLSAIERNADPDAQGAEPILDAEELRTLASEALAGIEEDPQTMLDLLETIGLIQYKIGEVGDAGATFEAALERSSSLEGAPSARGVRLLMLIAQTAEVDHADRQRTMALRERALRDAERIFDADDPRLLSVRLRMPIALDELEDLVARIEGDPQASPDDVMYGLSTLYWRYEFGPTPPKGLPFAKRWYERTRAHYGPSHSLTVNAMTAYANAESVYGSATDAIALLEEALERSIAIFGIDHHQSESAQRVLARVYGDTGQAQLGIPHAIEHEQRTRRLYGEGSVQHAGGLRILGTLLAQAGDLEQARALLIPALEANLRHWPRSNTMVTALESRLADVLSRLGDHDGADAHASSALALMRPASSAYPIALATGAKARAMRAGGDRDGAVRLIEQTLASFGAEGISGRSVEALVEVLLEMDQP